MDKGFDEYKVRGEVSLRNVEDIFMHLVMMCNGKFYTTTDNFVTYGEGLRSAIKFVLKLGGVIS